VSSWGEGEVGKAHHLKFDPEGNVWLSDVGFHLVRKFTPEGKLLLTLGTKDKPGDDETHLNRPTDMAITPAGDIFVSDGYGNSRVAHFDKHGKFVKSWGKLGVAPGDFNLPHAIALDSKGRLYVADRNNARVQVFDQHGKLLDVWQHLIVPWGFWVSEQDEIWVCGSTTMPWYDAASLSCPPKDQVFMKFSPEGKVLQIWTVPKGADGHEKSGELNWVHCMALDSHGNIYAGDIVGKRAQKFVLQK
jgi:streptogramin lyase